jgi:hypothetical protein
VQAFIIGEIAMLRHTCLTVLDYLSFLQLQKYIVEATIKYAGSPVLKDDGIFIGALATHAGAELGLFSFALSVRARHYVLDY